MKKVIISLTVVIFTMLCFNSYPEIALIILAVSLIFFISNALKVIEQLEKKEIMKGNYKEECNITACQKPNSAIWFNHSTRKYYCPSCAKRLNSDEYNKRDAIRIFGHDLCTLEIE